MATRLPYPGYPDGWFCAAFSADLPPGTLVTAPWFGEEIVVYRTRSGVLQAVDAYCPHLGAHFGHGGAVEGELLRCPFHDFRFDLSGTCVSTPYGRRPPRAVARTHQVIERQGIVLVRRGESVVDAPPEFDGAGWSAPRTAVWRIRTRPEEMTENAVDFGHFSPVHGYVGAELVSPFQAGGSTFTIGYTAEREVGEPAQRVRFGLDVTAFGVGCAVTDVSVAQLGFRTRTLLSSEPVDEETVVARASLCVRSDYGEEAAESLADLVLKDFTADFGNDIPMWEHKRYLPNPRLADGDGPIGTYRRWLRQFYPEQC